MHYHGRSNLFFFLLFVDDANFGARDTFQFQLIRTMHRQLNRFVTNESTHCVLHTTMRSAYMQNIQHLPNVMAIIMI